MVLTARNAESLNVLREELEALTDVLALAGDVANDEHVHALLRATTRQFGGIDVLINNASTLGASPMPHLEKLLSSTFNHVMNVNVRAPLHLIQHVLPGMRENGGGTIVNISSDAAVQAYAGWGGYGASKAALEHLSRILAEELSGSGVGVVVVDPGNMNTQMHRDAEPGADLSALPHPGEVAPAIVDAIDRAASGFTRLQAQALAASI